MASRKLKVENVEIENCTQIDRKSVHTILHIEFNRKLTPLEISGVRAVLDGEIK